MDSLGFKTVKIGKLVLPGDMPDRAKEPRVIEMSKTLEDVGLIEKPKVRKRDMLLIAGRDRVAAHMAAGLEEVVVEMVECADEDATKIDAISNAHRRHDRKEQERLMVELVGLYEKEEVDVPVDRDRGPGRPETPRGKARKRVAKQLGVRPESVRQAENRQKQRKADQRVRSAKPAVAVYGMPVGDEFVAECSAIQRYIDEAAAKLSAAQSTLQQLLNAEMDVPEAELDRVRESAHDLSASLRSLRPVSLCPYCKGIDGYQGQCAACFTRGWVGKSEMASMPKELLTEGEEAVIIAQGETLQVADLIDLDDADWDE